MFITPSPLDARAFPGGFGDRLGIIAINSVFHFQPFQLQLGCRQCQAFPVNAATIPHNLFRRFSGSLSRVITASVRQLPAVPPSFIIIASPFRSSSVRPSYTITVRSASHHRSIIATSGDRQSVRFTSTFICSAVLCHSYCQPRLGVLTPAVSGRVIFPVNIGQRQA